MKKTNSFVLLIISLLLIIIGGGIYIAQKSGRINLLAAFAGWSDVSTTDPAYTELMAVGERGWIPSFSDGTFRPDHSPDRASVVVSEVRALGLKLISTKNICHKNIERSYPFTDVLCSHWAVDYIWTAKQAGLIKAYSDGRFYPNRLATKAELISLLLDATKADIPKYSCIQTSDYPFQDVPCDFWAYKYLRYAKENNLISGDSTGNFEPDRNSSRRELGVILYRMFLSQTSEITITGHVVNIKNNKPIKNASVYVVESSAQGDQLTTKTDADGAYSLRFIASSANYTINAAASSFKSQSTSVIASQNGTVDFRLSAVAEAEGTVSGYVRDIDGVAISGANVSVIGYENGSQITDQTDASGFYSLSIGSTTGTFSIKADKSGYQAKTLPATLAGGVSTLNFTLAVLEENGNGETPDITDIVVGRNVNAASTGAVLPVALVLIGTILSLFSLIYLLKANKGS